MSLLRTSPARFLPALLLLAASSTSAGCSDPSREGMRGMNVLLISIDTLRPDHLSLYGYERETSPEIDAFFADADVYERAYSAEAATAPSVVSMLSGRYPSRHGVRLLYQELGPGIDLIPDHLRRLGYQTAGVVSNIVLTDEASALGKHFDHYDDFVDERESRRKVYERRASRTTDAALAWLASEREEGRPHFLWVHYIDPHGPYAPPENKPVEYTHEGEVPVELGRIHTYQRMGTDGLDYVDRYDEEIAYMDREVGRLLDAYEALGLTGRTVVVFTADHGETMIEYDRYFTHGYHVWEPIMRVPLMVRIPGREGRRIDIPVSLVDLMPTILEEMGLDVPEELDGVPLGERSPRDPISLEATYGKLADGPVQHRALVRGDQKWYVTVDREGEVRSRAWLDLSRHEEDALRFYEGEEEGFSRLLEWTAADPDPGGFPAEYPKGEKLDGPKVAPGRTEEELEALRALGYVE